MEAFTDFWKAYDTVFREFCLFAAPEQLGLGDSFVQWMEVLHAGAMTCAPATGFRCTF